MKARGLVLKPDGRVMTGCPACGAPVDLAALHLYFRPPSK